MLEHEWKIQIHLDANQLKRFLGSLLGFKDEIQVSKFING